MSVPYVVKTDGKTKLTPKTRNIDGSEDAFYRYKVRQLYIQVVGKGKMIKTVLLNVDEVSKDLQVPPSYFTAFLGYELGAQSKYDAKKSDRERAQLSGDIDSEEMATTMQRFIQEVVLCPVCHLPETTMNIDTKKSEITVNCRGCGSQSKLDLGAKFKQYVLNHPITVTTGTTKVEKEIQKKRDMQVGAADEKPASEKSSKGKKKSKKPASDSDSDGDWSCDTSAEAMAARRREALGVDSMMSRLVAEAAPAAEDPVAELKEVAEKNIDEVISASKELKTKHNFNEKIRVTYILKAVLNPNDPMDTLKKHKAFLDKVVTTEEYQVVLLKELEQICLAKETLTKKAAIVVKAYYDEDVLEEEAIMKWHNGLAHADLKKALQPLVTWLKEAEEDEDEDEDEDEESDDD